MFELAIYLQIVERELFICSNFIYCTNRARRPAGGGSTGWARKSLLRGEGGGVGGGGIGQPSVYHALVVIFLEFFAWGLLTNPMITVLAQTFPNHTFLMNGEYGHGSVQTGP